MNLSCRIILFPSQGTGDPIYKDKSLIALPRIGEKFFIDGNQFVVEGVEHNIDKGIIEIDSWSSPQNSKYFKEKYDWKPWPPPDSPDN